jgi:polycystin 1L2
VNTYFGGGYVFKMMKENNSIESLLNKIRDLEKLNWIDAQTSAIFLEFTLFNPNVNLFQHCLFVFEITSGGNFVTSSQLTPLNIFDLNDSSVISLKIILYLIYLGFVCILMALEARELMKSKWKDYFSNAYNYFDLAIVAFSWASFSMYLYRLYSAYDIYNKLKRNDDKDLLFINFQYIASCQILFDFLMGSCVFFATLRFIKTLRFNKRVIVYVHAFKQSLNELISFGVIFIIVWVSFVQVFYVLMNAETKEFASIYQSMESCFQIILGKFNSNAFVDSKSFLSEPIFVAYNVIILFIMVNLMISILVNGFDSARNDNDLNHVDVDVLAYVKDNIALVNPFVSKRNNKIGTKHVYIDFTKSFELRIDRYLQILKKVILMV